jgi:hypothetical protein
MTSKATFSASIPSTNVGKSIPPAAENSTLEARTQTAVQNHAIFGVKKLCIPDNATTPVFRDGNVVYSKEPKPELCLPKILTE